MGIFCYRTVIPKPFSGSGSTLLVLRHLFLTFLFFFQLNVERSRNFPIMIFVAHLNHSFLICFKNRVSFDRFDFRP